MKKPTYSNAIYWIAFNDEPTLMRIREVSEQVSVALIADLFEVEAVRVATDIVNLRTEDKNMWDSKAPRGKNEKT